MLRCMVLCAGLVALADVKAAEPERMRTIAQGNFSGVQTPTQLVVTNTGQWQELWKRHSAQRTPAEAAPEINFDKESVLFVALGRKSSGGHRIEIAGLKVVQGKTEVNIKARSPKPGGIQIQALTAPFHIVAVPKVTGPVEFKLEESGSEAR